VRLVKPLAAAVLVLVAALSLAVAAGARGGDRNRDRLPDRWEKRHHLSLKVKQTRRDQDRDGLRNLGEFRTGTDPRDDDSDGDGTEDGEENAGTIKSFGGGVLTVTLFAGGEMSGRVTDETELECDTRAGLTEQDEEEEAREEDDAPGTPEDDDDADEEGEGDEEEGDDDAEAEDSQAGSRCTDLLKAGVTIHEATLRGTAAGAVWEEIELISP
jgi:hypothetical protein